MREAEANLSLVQRQWSMTVAPGGAVAVALVTQAPAARAGRGATNAPRCAPKTVVT